MIILCDFPKLLLIFTFHCILHIQLYEKIGMQKHYKRGIMKVYSMA